MYRPRAYVETTIPSFYFDTRPSAIMVARRQWTRAWWAVALDRYELVTSLVTYAELRNGPVERIRDWLALIQPMPVLETTEAVVEAAATYVRERVMPRRGEDAYHLALASVHGCDYLVTWDIQHLANAHKAHHIHNINLKLGLRVPAIVTPLQLLGRLR